MGGDFESVVRAGLERAGVTVDDRVEVGLITYCELLAKWNRKINLTSFDLGAPSEPAIDRLIVEPLLAARAIEETDRWAVDVGSGGGSPALPLLLARPWLALTMVEVRQRKAAFLREAVRILDLAADVSVGLFEDFSRSRPARSIDVVSMRAVRPDARVMAGVSRLIAPGGKFLWFGNIGDITEHNDAGSITTISSSVHVIKVIAP